MEQYPLKDYIDKMFPDQPDGQRVVWANTFIDQKYDSIDKIKAMSHEQWQTVTKDLPNEVVSTLEG